MFSRKKKEINKEESTAGVVSASYNIVIWEKVGNTDSFVKELKAKRFVDMQDRTVYLINVKEKFLELLPQQERDFVNIPKSEIEAKLKKLRETLKKENEQDTADINDKNLEFEIMQLEAKLRYYMYSKDGSYLRFGKGGVKQYEFLRDGNTLYPYKRDLETSTIYVPSDTKRKKAGIARGNKINKYSKHKKMIEGGVVFLFFFSMIALCFSGYIMYKFWGLYDGSNLAESERASLDVANDCAEYVLSTAQSVDKITKSINNELNKPQTIIQGAEVK